MEYHSACGELPNRIPNGANHVALHAADEMVVPQSEELATQARLLLMRCVEANPKTPWAALAQWELDKGFGLRYTWRVVLPPVPTPPPKWSMPNFPSM